MYTKQQTEYQNPLCIVRVIEDIPGGATLKRSGLATTDAIKPGAVLAKASSGLFEVFKSVKVKTAAQSSDTTVQIEKGSEFVVGNPVMKSGGSVSTLINAIDKSNADYDVITLKGAIGALAVTDYLVLSAAEAASSAAAGQTPVGISLNEVDVTVDNQTTGVMVRGTVNESILPYKYPAAVKTALPLIRFI